MYCVYVRTKIKKELNPAKGWFTDMEDSSRANFPRKPQGERHWKIQRRITRHV